jgi:hypothetical protein
VNVAKRYLIHVAARNLGVIMRALFGIGTPRSLQGYPLELVLALWCAIRRQLRHLFTPSTPPTSTHVLSAPVPSSAANSLS